MTINWRRKHSYTLLFCSLIALLAALAGRTQAVAEVPTKELLAQKANDENLLLFKSHRIDSHIPYNRSEATTVEDGRALHIIQFTGPIQDSWLASVEATGAELVHYIANNGYLIWAGESSRSQLDYLAAHSHFLRFSAPYAASLKIDRWLHQAEFQSSTASETIVTIQMLRHDGRHQTEKLLDTLIICLLYTSDAADDLLQV